MTIDWFTFVAQILNFLILIWLMKRFLYGPIIQAMEQREATIAARLTDAATAEQAAMTRQRELQTQLDDLAKTREGLLADASREVEVWRTDHLEQARTEIETVRQQWQQSLTREKQSLLRGLQLDSATHATGLSRHVLQQLANADLCDAMVSRFVVLLKETDPESLGLTNAVNVKGAFIIETSHALSDEDRSTVRQAIVESGSPDIDPEFLVNPELICGIELRSTGCKLAWSVRDTLAEMESELIDSLDEVIPIEETSSLDRAEVTS